MQDYPHNSEHVTSYKPRVGNRNSFDPLPIVLATNEVVGRHKEVT